MALGVDYLKELKKRSASSHVHREFQLVGLEIADLLGDRKHKALYIKLAKQYGKDLIPIAKEVSAKKNVKNQGAYFMTVIAELRKNPKPEIFRSTAPKSVEKKVLKAKIKKISKIKEVLQKPVREKKVRAPKLDIRNQSFNF